MKRLSFLAFAFLAALVVGVASGAGPYSLDFTFGNYGCGETHTASDDTGQQQTKSTPNCPDTTKPVVSMTAPPAGNVSGTVAVSAAASDPTPPPPTQDVSGVANVQFKLDGANLGAADTSSPYSISWDTTGASNGSHTLSAVATDVAGNVSDAAPGVVVNVNNAAPPTANLWVDTDGGTCARSSTPALYNSATACASVQLANNAATCGDRITIAAGTYDQQTANKNCASATLTINCVSGAIMDRLPPNDASQAKAFIINTGANHLQLGPGCQFNDGVSVDNSATTDNITITGNTIGMATGWTNTSTWNDGASFGVVIRMSKVNSTVTVSNNLIRNIGYQCNNNGSNNTACDDTDNSFGGGISRGYCINDFDSQNLIITGNTIDRCWEDALQVDAVHLTFLDNDVKNVWNQYLAPGNHQDGIQIFSGSDTTSADIERNKFHGQDFDTCIRIQDLAHSGFIVRNNLCGLDDGSQVHGTGLDLENLSNSTVSFNTVNANFGSNVSQPDFASSGNTVEDNLMFPGANGTGLIVGTTSTTVRNNVAPSYSGPTCVNCLSVLPAFVNLAAGDYRLAAGANAVDAGIAETGVNLDVGSRPRPVGSAVDIGAWERQSSDP